MANLRDSGNIEQDADICMLMYRPDYYTSQGISTQNKFQRKQMAKGGQDEPEMPQPSEEDKAKNGDNSKTTIIVAKNRNGKTGELRFDVPKIVFPLYRTDVQFP